MLTKLRYSLLCCMRKSVISLFAGQNVRHRVRMLFGQWNQYLKLLPPRNSLSRDVSGISLSCTGVKYLMNFMSR